ncbi:phytoene synthase [Loktanella sp. IMCC34160]|uniref:squalene/phytoene synthase family protein n=1 Tax=Loktanella sp. IMCC34160 TaxID=2510646 RepID=UPI00101DA362|nr:squalene/phytoene synthase family protein [Loktanella sp. IMCC34160]RYG90851.1 phytoene synthase [Loktanella sp. IMCC34160]
MSLNACAALVERGDPDRFLAAMAAPPAARRVLFPLYAFNLEVARAPWVTEEPMIAEMRLQWWRDALEEIRDGKKPRAHEVVGPLAQILTPETAAVLDRMVVARRWDIYKEAFEDQAHFDEYLDHTGGALMWVAARCLGAHVTAAPAVTELGKATALVRFLQAVPDLESRKRIPLVDGRAEAIADLARKALDAAFARNIRHHAGIPKPARAALKEAWQTRPLLEQIIQSPERVAQGAVGLSPFSKKLRLLLAQ